MGSMPVFSGIVCNYNNKFIVANCPYFSLYLLIQQNVPIKEDIMILKSQMYWLTFYVVIFSLYTGCKHEKVRKGYLHVKESDTIYDIIKGEIVRETTDSLWFEPIEQKIPKVRKIFKKGKNYIYRAEHLSTSGQLISSSRIKLVSTGERVYFAPERQDKVFYVYPDYKRDSAIYSKISKIKYWSMQVEEGIIENIEEVWMHPMRHNQYRFTQIAPYPHVELPLQLGKTWETNLNIIEGWGEWSNQSGTSEYFINSKDSFYLENKSIECWVIKAQTDFPFGKSQVEFWFNEEYGFVVYKYSIYTGDKLIVTLIESSD